jgi:hypothetical protein
LEVRAIDFSFAVIAVPHRHDAPCVTPRRPDHHHHPASEIADRLHPRFAIVLTAIRDIHGQAGEQRCIGEIKRTELQGCRPLDWIEGDFHLFYVVTIKAENASLPVCYSGGMTDRTRIIKREAVPKCGSFEVRFPDGMESRFFYWDDIPSRRVRSDIFTREQALELAKAFARAERDKET